MTQYDVAIIGAGPAGIAAATGLVQAGITNIIVIEREAEIGGIPRHTHHPSFGLLVFKRPISGPNFIKKLLNRCPNVQFVTSTTVTKIHQDGKLDIATPEGMKTISARHIVLATGARETPRHGRLISGLRPQGVLTTGALQQFVYSQGLKPFKRPVIVGTELASFSALWTMRHAGIKPVAMIEEGDRVTAYKPASVFARLLGVPIYYRSTVVDIAEVDNICRVQIKHASGENRQINCDGIIFSGKFVGDNNLARTSQIALHPITKIPLSDQNWLGERGNISVIGNAIHPADMGDQCYLEGLKAGKTIAGILDDTQQSENQIIVLHDADIKMTTPNMVRANQPVNFDINLHVTKAYSGPVTVKYNGEILYQKTRTCLPARRITLRNIALKGAPVRSDQSIHVSLSS